MRGREKEKAEGGETKWGREASESNKNNCSQTKRLRPKKRTCDRTKHLLQQKKRMRMNKSDSGQVKTQEAEQTDFGLKEKCLRQKVWGFLGGKLRVLDAPSCVIIPSGHVFQMSPVTLPGDCLRVATLFDRCYKRQCHAYFITHASDCHHMF